MIEYLPKASEQLIGFFYSAGIGLALGFFYELLRILFFIVTGSDKKFTLARDIIFLLFCLTVTFFFFLVRYNGKVMFYAVLGELLGGYAAFRLTDSAISYFLKRILHRVRKNCIIFSSRLRNKFRILASKIKKCKKFIIKDKNFSKNDLHNRQVIVYNQSVTVYPLQEDVQNRGDENG